MAVAVRKFYPGRFRVDGTSLGQATSPTYVVHKGFFSSIHPGRESLLLNVNPATTAFYPPIILQDWIRARWPFAAQLPRPNPIDWTELKLLRVTFEGHKKGADGYRKRWKIFDILLTLGGPPQSRLPLNGVPNAGQCTTILDYMRSSKYLPPNS